MVLLLWQPYGAFLSGVGDRAIARHSLKCIWVSVYSIPYPVEIKSELHPQIPVKSPSTKCTVIGISSF
jgi:hypothetical protein